MKSPFSNGFSIIRILLFAIPLSSATLLYGQDDTVRHFKNTVKYNVSNPMFFGWKFNVFGYERVIKDYQTASVSFGRTAFPFFSYNSDSLSLNDNYNDKGFNFSMDYRFYLQKENRHKAPRGIYIGPYLAYNHFSRDIAWDMNTTGFTGSFNTEFDLNALLLGMQLGYQFVFWERITLDLVLMGPGWWHFTFKTEFDSELTSEEEALVLEELNNLVKDKFPASDFVFTGQGFEFQKNTSSDVIGLRYLISIGFRF